QDQKNSGSTRFKKIFDIFTPLSIFLSDFSQNNERFQTTRNKDRIPAIKATRYSLLSTAGIGVMCSFAFSGIQSVFLLYVRYKFELPLTEQGYLLNSQNLKRQGDIDDDVMAENEIIVQDEKRMNRELVFDIWAVRVGLAIDVVAYSLYAIATNGVLLFAACLGAISTISVPALKSIQTNLVPPSQMGQLL
ncbi:7016_t:CDS:2, partial [Racocetra fulgida]